VVTSSSLPISLVVGPGNEHDSKRFEHAVSSIRINTGKGRQRNKPGEVLADAAYDTEAIRIYLRRRGIKSSIPENQTACGHPTLKDGVCFGPHALTPGFMESRNRQVFVAQIPLIRTIGTLLLVSPEIP
jgi:transposase